MSLTGEKISNYFCPPRKLGKCYMNFIQLQTKLAIRSGLRDHKIFAKKTSKKWRRMTAKGMGHVIRELKGQGRHLLVDFRKKWVQKCQLFDEKWVVNISQATYHFWTGVILQGLGMPEQKSYRAGIYAVFCANSQNSNWWTQTKDKEFYENIREPIKLGPEFAIQIPRRSAASVVYKQFSTDAVGSSTRPGPPRLAAAAHGP